MNPKNKKETYGGYDVELFKSEEIRKLICPLCLKVVSDPIILCQMEHDFFCASCLHKHISQKEKENEIPKCPNCKSKLDLTIEKRNPKVKNMINEAQIFCPNGNNGCNVPDLVLEQLEKHIEICPYQILSCPIIGCQHNCIREKMSVHLKECPHRLANCKLCSITLKLGQIKVYYRHKKFHYTSFMKAYAKKPLNFAIYACPRKRGEQSRSIQRKNAQKLKSLAR